MSWREAGGQPRVTAYASGVPRELVGCDNVMARTVCGFTIHVGTAGVDPDGVWAKLSSLEQGACLAGSKLRWRR